MAVTKLWLVTRSGLTKSDKPATVKASSPVPSGNVFPALRVVAGTKVSAKHVSADQANARTVRPI